MDRQIYDRMRLIQADHWWFKGRRRILAGLIGDMGLPPDAAILEAGCGCGGNLAMLSRFGQVVGMEPDPDSRAYAAETSGVRVEGGFLPAGVPFAETKFDLICAFDVIEHVDEDAAALAALGARLKPGGRMALTVPAHPWMWTAHDELHHHKRRYELPQFRALAQGAGLNVVKASYFNSALFAPIAAARLIRGGKGGADDAMPPAPANRLLAWLFGAELGWLRRASFPFGVSILLIAERPS